MKKTDNNNNFKAPEGYFDSLSDQIFLKMEREKINYNEGSDFGVPKGYFDALTDKVLAKLKVDERKTVLIGPLKKYYYIAASIAAVILIMIGLLPNRNDNILANSDIEGYFEFIGLDVSYYELAEMFPVGDMDINEILDFQLTNENVIDYLSNNIKDLDELNLNNDD